MNAVERKMTDKHHSKYVLKKRCWSHVRYVEVGLVGVTKLFEFCIMREEITKQQYMRDPILENWVI